MEAKIGMCHSPPSSEFQALYVMMVMLPASHREICCAKVSAAAAATTTASIVEGIVTKRGRVEGGVGGSRRDKIVYQQDAFFQHKQRVSFEVGCGHAANQRLCAGA
jgi:hypothetical protein